jgi:capsular polysaccharide biosynthesis protein
MAGLVNSDPAEESDLSYICITTKESHMDIFEKERQEGIDFIRVVLRNHRMILIFVAVACLATGIITWFIPKEYTSSGIVFPTETNSIDDVIRNPQFGYDVEADRLIQILSSRQIRDSISARFRLLDYFGIDTTDTDWYDQLKKKYEREVTFSKTTYMSIVISARTRSPEMSAEIVNTIIALANSTRDRLLKQNILLATKSLERESSILKMDLDSLSGVVDRLMSNKPGLRQFIQTDRYISMVFDKQQLGDDQTAQALQIVINQYNVRLSWYYDVQSRLKNANLIEARPLPSVYVIETAVPSYKKSFPHLSLNLLVALAGSFLFISFGLFFYDKIKELRTRLN